MDNEIRIRWSGGEATFGPGDTVLIGREPSAQVVSSNSTVSRRHAEVRLEGGMWRLRDLGSTQGTHVEGRRTTDVVIDRTMTVTLGDPSSGEAVTLVVAADEATSVDRGADSGTAQPAAADHTVVVGSGPERPGGRLQQNQLSGATVVTGQTINIEAAGRTYSFEPGATIVVGRDESCDVTVPNPTVSRRHASLQYGANGWSIADLGSSSGTFIDDRRITSEQLSGSTAVLLGTPDTGERMVVVTSGPTKPAKRTKRRGGVGVLVALLAVAALVLAAGAFWLAGRGGPDNNQLARATVLIQTDTGSGSGSIVDAEQGLILTNAHVADPTAPGLAIGGGIPSEADEAGELRISVSPELDRAAEFEYIAEVVESDGYLDLAVLRITKTSSGALVEDGDLEGLTEVALGNSAEVRSGENVSVFGFPGNADSQAVSVTRGVVQGGVQDDRLGDNRAYFNVDAVVNPGNSGGLAADDAGRLIGVPTLVRLGELDELGRPVETGVSSIRPIDYARPMIEAAQGDGEFDSPSDLRPITDEVIDEDSIDIGVAGDRIGMDFGECESSSRIPSDALPVAFSFEGFADDRHQDLAIVVVDGADNVIGFWESNDDYPLRWPDSGCGTVTVPLFEPVSGDSVVVLMYLGPSYEEVAAVRFRLN